MKYNQELDQEDERWSFLRESIVNFASGNFRIPPHEPTKGDELDALIQGIVMLGEELRTSTISKNYLQRIYTGINDIVLILDLNFEVKQANDAAVKMLGYTSVELNGIPLYALFEGNVSGTFEQLINQISTGKDAIENFELWLKCKNGTTIPVSVNISFIGEDQNVENEALFVAKNITDLVETQNRLKERNEELSTLLYRLSHDLRSPLANILGLLDLVNEDMKNGGIDLEQTVSLLDKVVSSAHRIDHILFYFNELHYIGNESQLVENVNINQLLVNTHEFLLHTFDSHTFELTMELNTLHHEILLPSKLLKLIINNLLLNAIQFRKLNEVAQVKISLFKENKELVIEVSDNGIGIPTNLKSKVFGMFFKGSNQSNGAGLGLYFIKNAVDQLKGKIEFQSIEGEGTTVKVNLPVG